MVLGIDAHVIDLIDLECYYLIVVVDNPNSAEHFPPILESKQLN